jgi:hypothetical protein
MGTLSFYLKLDRKRELYSKAVASGPLAGCAAAGRPSRRPGGAPPSFKNSPGANPWTEETERSTAGSGVHGSRLEDPFLPPPAPV